MPTFGPSPERELQSSGFVLSPLLDLLSLAHPAKARVATATTAAILVERRKTTPSTWRASTRSARIAGEHRPAEPFDAERSANQPADHRLLFVVPGRQTGKDADPHGDG